MDTDVANISWPRKAPEHVFIRFGRWSSDDCRSRNWATGEKEKGLSVYLAKFVDGVVIPDEEDLDICIRVVGRLCFPVTGRIVGTGSDGEPLLRGVRVLPYPMGYKDMPAFLSK